MIGGRKNLPVHGLVLRQEKSVKGEEGLCQRKREGITAFLERSNLN